ncbi:MAG: ATP synthase subunit b 1 [Alphaproteobacteria bacterium]|nr:MAG: ATP synthase subunit b 1 [Alphaproteobacteria bacterium]
MDILHSPEFWVAVAFVLFVVLAGKPLYRAIAGQLDARAMRIKAQLDEAQRLRDEAQQLLSEYQRKQRDAVREAEEILAHAKDEAARLKSEAASNLEATLKRREKMALDKIAQAEAQALKEVRHEAVDIAIAAAERILAKSVDEQRQAALVDQAIGELDSKLH